MSDERKPMTDEELAAIQGRLTKATPGPWVFEEPDGKVLLGYTPKGVRVCESGCLGSIASRFVCDMHNDWRYTYKDKDEPLANAALIAHAPDDISRLLAEVRRLNKVSRYLAEQMVHDGGAGLKWAGAFDEDCMRMYKTREEAIQSWIDEANRAVNNDDK